MYEPLVPSLCKKQTPEKLDKAGGCLLARRDHSQCSAHCPSHAWESPPGACNRRATYQPQPFHAVPRLTSVKKPAIPAWHEPCSSPYFFLYSGWKKGRKQTVVIPATHSSPEPPALLFTQPGETPACRAPGFHQCISHQRAPCSILTHTRQHHTQPAGERGQSAPTEQYHSSMKRACSITPVNVH